MAMVPLPLRAMDVRSLQRVKIVPPVNPCSLKPRSSHQLFAQRNIAVVKSKKPSNGSSGTSGSPPRRNYLQVRFHDVQHDILATIKEEEECEEMSGDQILTDHHNDDLPHEFPHITPPFSNENIDRRPSINCGHIPHHNHPTVWDKLVHHLASRFGSSRYELHKGNDPIIKSNVKQKELEKTKRFLLKKDKNFHAAHKYLEEEVSPVSYDGKRFHFHGRC